MRFWGGDGEIAGAAVQFRIYGACGDIGERDLQSRRADFHGYCMTRVAIGAIMKQEAPYILEWVYYHKELGFELIIADNGGTDDTSKILIALHNAKIITRIDFRFIKKAPQIPAYRAILRLARRMKIDILGFLDCDEFFTRHIPIHSLSPEDGAEYIASEFKRLNATQISYHWLLYGSKTIHKDISLPVLERFKYHSKIETKRNVMDKSFIIVSEMFKITNVFLLGPKILTPHHFHGATKRWYLDDELIKKFDFHHQKISHNKGAILHFQIKTLEEYQSKVNRGGGDTRWSRYTECFFQENDFNDIKSEINQQIIYELNNGINNLRNVIRNNHDLLPRQSKLETVKSRIDAIGLSDIGNHKILLFVYKQRKKLQKFIKVLLSN